jgi:hypothetical protein
MKKRHALFAGGDIYVDGQIPNLACAVNDAEDLRGFFKYGRNTTGWSCSRILRGRRRYPGRYGT